MSILLSLSFYVGFYFEKNTVMISYNATFLGQQDVVYFYLIRCACNNEVQDVFTSSRLIIYMYLREKVVIQEFGKL